MSEEVDTTLARIKERLDGAKDHNHPITFQDEAFVDLWERIRKLEQHTHIAGLDWSGPPRYDKGKP